MKKLRLLTSFINDENAVSVITGHMLNLVILTTISVSIIGAFYLYVDYSSQQSMSIGFTDIGTQVARDITNMQIISGDSNNISLNVRRDIPLTFGGRGYNIRIKDAGDNGTASVEIRDGSFFNHNISIGLDSINTNVNMSGVVYSGSGKINISMTKNDTGAVRIWIK